MGWHGEVAIVFFDEFGNVVDRFYWDDYKCRDFTFFGCSRNHPTTKFSSFRVYVCTGHDNMIDVYPKAFPRSIKPYALSVEDNNISYYPSDFKFGLFDNPGHMGKIVESQGINEFEKPRASVFFSCDHLTVDWPTSFCLYSQKEGGCNIIFPTRTWSVLVDYCFGYPGRVEKGPTRFCCETLKRVFCVRLFGKRDWKHVYPALQDRYANDPEFGYDFFIKNRDWVRDLTREGVESNPGPAVLSKNKICDISDLWSIIDFVPSQGFGDFLNIPTNITNFTKDFNAFVAKLPDKEFVDAAFMSINNQANQIIDILSNTTQQVQTAIETTMQSGSYIKNIIIGALVIIAFSIMAKNWGLTSAIVVLIVSFLMHYFELYPLIRDFILDNGMSMYDYFKKNYIRNEVVELQSFGNPVVDSLVNPDNLGALLAALFTAIFVGSVKCHPSTKDYEDFSRKIFNYQRGVTSVVASYDKLKDFWSWTVEKICDRFELNLNSDIVTKHTIGLQIEKWLAQNTIVFREGYDHKLSMELRLKYVERIRTQYNLGLDLINTCDRIDRAKAAIVRFWVDKLHKKLEELGTESLEGTIRNPPTTILLYGPSGVGKSSLITGLASFCGRVHAVLRGCEQPAVGSVYVRNCDQAHYDGYTNQHTLVIDDFLSRKDSETNPNLEAGELIKIKNNVPFPLPMAHLPEKGRVFNSQVVIMTTNCRNVTKALGSMNFPYATANRLTDASFVCYVLPPYRKFISESDKAHLQSIGLFDQHSVDPMRARYSLRVNSALRCIPLDESHALDTYSDAEFESLRGEERLLPNGQPQHMNYDIYYFQRLDVKTGKITGQPLSWGEFLNEIERVYTVRMTMGENMLEQTKWFHNTSLAHMKQGIIDVPEYVRSQMNDDFEEDGFHEAQDDELLFAVRFAATNFEDLHNVRQPAMRELLHSYLARWPNFEDLVAEYMARDEEAEEIQTRWQLLWSQCKEKYNRVQQQVLNMDVVKVLKWAGVVTYGIVVAGACFYSFKAIADKFKQPQIKEAMALCAEETNRRNKMKGWFARLFSGSSPIAISRDQVPLSGSDLRFLFDFCGYDVVQSQAASYSSGSSNNSARNGKYRTYVPSHSFDMDMVSDVARRLDVNLQKYDEGVFCDMEETKVPVFLVKLEACQITEQVLDYIIPQNTFILRAFSSKNQKKYDFGNVFFLDDRKFIMPHHYMLMLKYQLRVGNLAETDVVSFLRGPTTLEYAKKTPPNKITCTINDILDYAQIISRAYLDDPAVFNKDAVVVGVKNMSGFSCSNMLKKFITREEFGKLNDPGLSGYLIGQRLTSNGDDCRSVALPCVDVTPVNRFKMISHGQLNNHSGNDLVGLASAGPVNAPVYFESVIRDRYNYKADTRQGDCGMVLYLESPQLQRGLVGIHVAGDNQVGRANSVPLTQEDLIDAISRLSYCNSECFSQPDLKLLDEQDVAGIIPNVPRGDFHYIGRLSGPVPLQPLKTNIRPSVAQLFLPRLKDLFRARTVDAKTAPNGREIDVTIKKAPAVLRVHFQNPEKCKIFYGRKGELLYENEDGVVPLTPALWNVWLARGGVVHDVFMKGLEKTSLRLPYINPRLIDRAVLATQQKFLRMGPNSICPFEKALCQNLDLSSSFSDDVMSVIRRRNMLFQCLENRKLQTPKEIYEFTMRKVALSAAEGAVFREHLGEPLIEFVCNVEHDLNNLSGDEISRTVKTVNPMILTIEQSVQGIPGDPTISSINSKKSPGYPYTSLGLNFGKKPWVGKECKCDGERWFELKHDVENLIEEAKTCIPAVYFVATLKDELRPIQKIKDFKTRVFCAGPMHFTIAFRMYFMRFLSFVQENRLYNESALGINYYSREWETLSSYLSHWDGPTCIAGDYTNFDGSLSNQIMEKILDIVQAFYNKYGATEEERTIRRNLWLCLTRSMVIGRNGCVFRLFNSQPSGNPYTTMINILFNSVVFRMAYAEIFSRVTAVRRDIYNFEDDVHFISYGDDNAANINPRIMEWFNMQTISDQLKQYGLTYTDESKSGDLIKGRLLTDINFLKRGFKKVSIFSRTWVAPLDIDTVKEIFMWVRKGDENAKKKILADGLATSLQEMALHGEEAYNDWCIFAQGFEIKELLGKDMIPIPDFETNFARVCEKDLDLDQC